MSALFIDEPEVQEVFNKLPPSNKAMVLNRLDRLKLTTKEDVIQCITSAVLVYENKKARNRNRVKRPVVEGVIALEENPKLEKITDDTVVDAVELTEVKCCETCNRPL